MSSKIDLQKEALSELSDYSEKIIMGTELVIKELRNGRKEDTEELFGLVIKGINWEIEVFNNCESLINKDGQQIDMDKMAQAVARLGNVLKEKDDIKLAACLDVDFLPFLKAMEFAALSVGE